MIEKKEDVSTMADKPGAYVRILEGDVSRVPSASGLTWVELPSAITTPTPPSSEYITLTARNDERCVAAHSIGARDTRAAPIVGALQPGNTVVHSRGTVAGVVREAAKAPVPFADAVEIAMGACMAVGVPLKHVESRDGMLYVLIRGNYEQTLHVEQLVSAAMPAVVVQVLFARPRDSECVGARDTRAAALDDEILSWGRSAAVRPSPRETMVAAIITRQVEQGGVDTEGTRAQAERWCAMLAECVCDGMRATTLIGSLKLSRKDMWGRENVLRGTPLGRP